MALIGLIDLEEALDARADAALHRALREAGVMRTIAPAEGATLDRGDRILLVGAGTLLDSAMIAAMADGAMATLACLPNELNSTRYELIDGATRWAGWAALPGDMVAETAQALAPDWSLSSTLVRRAVQAGALRVDASRTGSFISLDAPNAVAEIDEARLSAAMRPRTGISGRVVERLASTIAKPLLGVAHKLRWASAACVAALATYGVTLGYGLLAPAALALLILVLASRVTHGLAFVVGQPLPWLDRGTGWLALLGLVAATGWTWTWSGQWGVIPLAIVLAADTAMATEDEAALGEPLWWRADVPAYAAIMFIGALGGQPIAALAVATAYASASLAVARRRLRAQRDPTAT